MQTMIVPTMALPGVVVIHAPPPGLVGVPGMLGIPGYSAGRSSSNWNVPERKRLKAVLKSWVMVRVVVRAKSTM